MKLYLLKKIFFTLNIILLLFTIMCKNSVKEHKLANNSYNLIIEALKKCKVFNMSFDEYLKLKYRINKFDWESKWYLVETKYSYIVCIELINNKSKKIYRFFVNNSDKEIRYTAENELAAALITDNFIYNLKKYIKDLPSKKQEIIYYIRNYFPEKNEINGNKKLDYLKKELKTKCNTNIDESLKVYLNFQNELENKNIQPELIYKK